MSSVIVPVKVCPAPNIRAAEAAKTASVLFMGFSCGSIVSQIVCRRAKH
jgi:alpha/beta superfamily hydrolase